MPPEPLIGYFEEIQRRSATGYIVREGSVKWNMQWEFLGLVGAAGGCWVCAQTCVGFDRSGRYLGQWPHPLSERTRPRQSPFIQGQDGLLSYPPSHPAPSTTEKLTQQWSFMRKKGILGRLVGSLTMASEKPGLHLKAVGGGGGRARHKGHWLLCLSSDLQGHWPGPAPCSLVSLYRLCIHILL